MDLALTAEQDELRDTLADFVAAECPPETVDKAITEPEVAARLWRLMGEQLGLPALVVPEEHDGVGAGFGELAVVIEQLGAALVPSPLFATSVLATPAILTSGDEAAAARLLPEIAGGARTATVAVPDVGGPWLMESVRTVAEPAPEGSGAFTLSGTKRHVLDGATADTVLVAARTAVGVSLFAVDGDASGVQRRSAPALDQTRPQATVTFDRTPAALVGADGEGWSVLEHVRDLCWAAVAAEAVGGADRCLSATVSYLGTRIQFGRPLGANQALQHRAADIATAVEGARAAARYAAWTAAQHDDELPVAAPVAMSACTEAYLLAAAENLQLHGGIGFTWEHEAHRYLKRAKTTELLFGAPHQVREVMTRRTLASAG